MNFNNHYKLKGQHAFLGASKYSWLSYDTKKLESAYRNYVASTRGTILHEFAETCIKLKQKLPRSKKTLNAYVNDAIGFGLVPEQILYYSDNCFGTADAIGYDEKNKILRIFDLKTGLVTPAKMDQLFIYDALFCLEYHINPYDICFENRIYQFDECVVANPEPSDIMLITNKIVEFDKVIERIKSEVDVA